MEQTIPAYTTTTDGDFTVESNSPEAPAPAQAEPVEAAAGADAQAEEAKAAAERDEQGRFKAKAAKADGGVDETPEPEKAEPEPVKKAKPREDPEARISQSVARQREAERRAEAAERKAAELEARLRTPEPAKTERPSAPPADRFPRYQEWSTANPEGDYDDYTRELVRHERATWESEHAEQAREQHYQRHRHELQAKFAQSLDAAVKRDNAFLSAISDDVLNLPTLGSLGKNEKPNAWHFIGEELLRSDAPTRLMQHWTEHPDEFQALASLPQREITRRIAKLESQLDAAPETRSAPPAPVISQAKPPVRRVPVSPSPASDEPPGDDADFQTHKRYWDARDRRAQGR